MVELCLCFMGFVMLTVGVMEFSMAIYAYNFCSYAARDGARWASVHGSQSASPATPDSVRSYVRAQAIALTSSNVLVTTTWTPDNTPGAVVKVVVAYTVTPLAYLALKQNLSVSSTSQVTIAH